MFHLRLFLKRNNSIRCAMLVVCMLFSALHQAHAQSEYTIFDDKMLLDGYAEKYAQEPKEILLAMIDDETLSSYKTAAAVRVFKEQFATEIFAREKTLAIKSLLRRLARTKSSFVDIEIMHTLCVIDRYKYFASMMPALIQKLDHYNDTVNEITYASINNIIETGHNRPREARIVFNTLRKILFLSRKKLRTVKTPDIRLKKKLELIRWSVKILGSQELRRLPSEVINLL